MQDTRTVSTKEGQIDRLGRFDTGSGKKNAAEKCPMTVKALVTAAASATAFAAQFFCGGQRRDKNGGLVHNAGRRHEDQGADQAPGAICIMLSSSLIFREFPPPL